MNEMVLEMERDEEDVEGVEGRNQQECSPYLPLKVCQNGFYADT